ncbi:MAG: protoporphyrinogen oxidase [Simkaniaceae bacterium]|nr:protoporphyrinogen oxidase [Simkaniaceae bacterium]
MKKITIAGGGISGLAARYYLSKKYPNAEIVLFEKSNRLGGCIESCHSPFFFERGPRTFKASRAEPLLNLIDEVGLSGEILYSSQQASQRFLWKGGKLQTLSPFSPLVVRLIPALLKEWKQPYLCDEDETIANFVSRRLGNYAAETFFDPLTLGIFAGDIHKLSISACFPELKAMEREYGSITHALFKKKKRKKRKGLFTLRGGLQTLIDRLVEQGRGKIHLKTPLTTLGKEERVILALSSQGMKKLFAKDKRMREFFHSVEEASLSVVNVAYSQDLLKKKGFGYLIPSSEKENILGVVFDSALFPLQNQTSAETRLTVMLRSGGIKAALEGLQRHLGIESAPSEVHLKVWKNVIPQYGIGHLKRVQAFESHLKMHYPQVTCIGNYINGASLNHCILLATQVS